MTTAEKTRQRNKKYWERRALAMEEDASKQAEAVSNRIAKSYRRSLRNLDDEISRLYVEILEKGTENITRTELYRLNHWNKLRQALTKEVTGLASAQSEELDNLLIDVATEAFGMNIQTFGREWNLIDDTTVKGIVSQNWSGISYSERIWKNAEAFNSRVLTDVEKLITEGANPRKLKKALRYDFGVSYSEADRLIRTEASHAFNSAALESYKEFADGVKVLVEPGCCEICADYKGITYDPSNAPVIPAHPNCRCTYQPIIDLKGSVAKQGTNNMGL